MSNDHNIMLSTAILLATQAHYGQFDKQGLPYIMHPAKVCAMLRTDDLELMCIAYLHDVLEDTSITEQDLRQCGMSERVVEGVKCLTKTPNLSQSEYETQVLSNIDAMLVKRSDLRHNSDIRRLKDVRQKDLDRTMRYYQFFLKIEAELVKRGII